MSTNDADLEYGPTPENAEHEHTDIEPSIAWKFGIWLVVAMAISAAIVYSTFWFFERQEARTSEAARVFPLAAGRIPEPPLPHLQTQPFKDIFTLRQSEQEKLSKYEWVDKATGTVRMPIEDTLRLMTERGLLPSRVEQPTELNNVILDSSAGRVAVPR